MQIDCYGFEAASQWFRRKKLEVYLMKVVEGILYLCYRIHWGSLAAARMGEAALTGGALFLDHLGSYFRPAANSF